MSRINTLATIGLGIRFANELANENTGQANS
jgi:hypothetical protein